MAIALAAAAGSPTAHAAAADDVASLYGPQPPADATFLRVVNLSEQTAKVALPSGGHLVDLAPGTASRLDVVRPGTPLRVTVDAGEPKGEAGGAKVAGADTVGETLTVALERDEAGSWHARPIAAPVSSTDALRAQLRLFNFVEGCDGKVALERNPASAIFSDVAAGHAASRSINPVTATLVAVCGAAVSPPFALPRLAAGQSFSLFLSGSPARPVLSGALDTLEWPGRKP
ncbi:alginate O-acetyltransferase AlgF [Trinickia dinghuensis]|nr:alginate O-acetyltransferase AlgF [Trinickia dinghuensis]